MREKERVNLVMQVNLRNTQILRNFCERLKKGGKPY